LLEGDDSIKPFVIVFMVVLLRPLSHINTQTIHKIQRKKNLGSAGRALSFALQLRKKHGKTSVRVAQYKNNEFETFGGQIGIRLEFSHSTSSVPCHYLPTNASFIS
jgi:hypothetical protein